MSSPSSLLSGFAIESDSDSEASDFVLARQLDRLRPPSTKTKNDIFMRRRNNMASPPQTPKITLTNAMGEHQSKFESVQSPPPISPTISDTSTLQNEDNPYPHGHDSEESTPIVTWEEHTSNDEIFCTGAVSGSDEIEGFMDEDDNTHCAYGKISTDMPYKIVRRNDLMKMGLGLSADESSQELPSDFITTCLGISLTWNETYKKWRAAHRTGDASFSWSTEFAKSLRFRGGFVPQHCQQVLYPEDIIPLEHIDVDSRGDWAYNGKTEVHHMQYWQALKEQGKVWDEMPEIHHFSR